jgi:hypothetical protein
MFHFLREVPNFMNVIIRTIKTIEYILFREAWSDPPNDSPIGKMDLMRVFDPVWLKSKFS